MRVHNRVSNTSVEGPGQRFAIWTQGCNIKCPGCFNTQAQDLNAGVIIPENMLAIEIANAVDKYGITGVTIAGGEPLLQPDALDALLTLVSLTLPSLDIMLYTGFEIAKINKDSKLLNVCRKADLLISEPYVQALSPDTRRWVGSSNQILTLYNNSFCNKYFPWPKANKSCEIIIGDSSCNIIGSAYTLGE